MSMHVIAAVIALLIVFWAVGAYRRLSAQRKQCKAAFADFSAQLGRRHELVSTLAVAANVGIKAERDALHALRAAQDEAAAIHAKIRANAFDLAVVARLDAVEAALGSVLTTVLASMQHRPELQSDRNLRECIEQLHAGQNRIGFARQVYNEAAIQYNAARAQFPVAAIAVVFAFTPAALLNGEQ